MELSDRVIEIFKAIAQVPRQSKHEAKISAWLADRAKSSGFEVERDDANNVIIRVPATKGYENAPIIALQGHMDMVCEKTPTSTHNFDTDPIEVIIEGDWMHANQTTLGADDGLGVALALAMAEDPNVEHPRLEIIITSDEETGMTGAIALKPESVHARIHLNLDSEDEGIFTVGCAGGRETTSTLDLSRAPLVAGSRKVDIHVTGLLGGHSGCEIHLGRASAIKLINRIIARVLDTVSDARLVTISGGSEHNAIPRDAVVSLAVAARDSAKVVEIAKEMGAIFANEYASTDPSVVVTTDVSDIAGDAFDNASLRRISDLIYCYPHGVSSMNHDVEGLVETSNNFARIRIEGNQLKTLSSQRSNVASKLDAITQRVEACIRLAGGVPNSGEGYPGWQPDMNADIVHRCVDVYEKRFGKKPIVNVIHAGLECGLIGAKIPGIQMISFGPTVVSPHSPKERAQVSTISMVADFIVDLFKTYR